MTSKQLKEQLEIGDLIIVLPKSEAESIKGLDYILVPEITDNVLVKLTGKYAKNIKVLQDAGRDTVSGYRIEAKH